MSEEALSCLNDMVFINTKFEILSEEDKKIYLQIIKEINSVIINKVDNEKEILEKIKIKLNELIKKVR